MHLCGSLYANFKTSFQSYTFYNKWLQTLFKYQLDRSKATRSFNNNSLTSEAARDRLEEEADLAWLKTKSWYRIFHDIFINSELSLIFLQEQIQEFEKWVTKIIFISVDKHSFCIGLKRIFRDIVLLVSSKKKKKKTPLQLILNGSFLPSISLNLVSLL